MQDLADSLTKATTNEAAPWDDNGAEMLRKAAIAWSSYCLQTFSGKTLRLGIGISLAVVAFLNELEATGKEVG